MATIIRSTRPLMMVASIVIAVLVASVFGRHQPMMSPSSPVKPIGTRAVALSGWAMGAGEDRPRSAFVAIVRRDEHAGNYDLEYKLTNKCVGRKFALGVIFAPHSFADLSATLDGFPLPRKPASRAHGSQGNLKIIRPDMSYSAVVKLDELFDMRKRGVYRFFARTRVDLIDENDIEEGSLWCQSNEVTLSVP